METPLGIVGQNYVLRGFRVDDLPGVVHVNLVSLPEHYSEEFYVEIQRNFPEAFIVGELAGKIVAYIMCRMEWGFSPRRLRPMKRGHIVSVAVLEEHRGRGIGTALMEVASEAMRKRGCHEQFLEVRVSNEGAVQLYRRMGFDIAYRIPAYYRDGEDAYLMVRQLEE